MIKIIFTLFIHDLFATLLRRYFTQLIIDIHINIYYQLLLLFNSKYMFISHNVI